MKIDCNYCKWYSPASLCFLHDEYEPKGCEDGSVECPQCLSQDLELLSTTSTGSLEEFSLNYKCEVCANEFSAIATEQ